MNTHDKIIDLLRQAEGIAWEDAADALKLNNDAKYWAALGRQSAYRHVIGLLDGRDDE